MRHYESKSQQQLADRKSTISLYAKREEDREIEIERGRERSREVERLRERGEREREWDDLTRNVRRSVSSDIFAKAMDCALRMR